MKITAILWFLFLAGNMSAQSAEMEDALRKVVVCFDTDTSLAMWEKTSDDAEEASMKWGDQWISHYYAAYTYIIRSFLENGHKQKDALLDCADVHLSTASALTGENNDEIIVLKAFSAHARMTVDPVSRWKKCGDRFNDNFLKARAINPNNPRIYYIKGLCLYYAPYAGEGGVKAAYPYFEMAARLFSLQPDSQDITKPLWGKSQNATYLQKCRQLAGE